MDGGIFEARCPCCGAKLEIDGDRGVILGHEPPKRAIVPENLQDAVKRLKSEETAREQRFRDQFDAEREHGAELQKRFEGLLKKAKSEKPGPRFPRDIDLD